MTTKTWRGFDYRLGQEVERPRKEWRELIAQVETRGGRTVRHRDRRGPSDLLIIDTKGQIVAEVYDQE